MNGIYKGAGISGATSHSGIRIGLTNLAERGAGVRVLMALEGHSNMATTHRYIDLCPAMLKAAVGVGLSKFLNERSRISNQLSAKSQLACCL